MYCLKPIVKEKSPIVFIVLNKKGVVDKLSLVLLTSYCNLENVSLSPLSSVQLKYLDQNVPTRAQLTKINQNKSNPVTQDVLNE